MGNLASGMSAALLVLIATVVQAHAQALGTFRWQLQPFCNVITLSVTQTAEIYTLDGFDDQCGAAARAGASGIAFLNPDGSIGIGLTVVGAPGGAPLHVDATFLPGSLSGTWRDSSGRTGPFVFTPGLPVAGPVRPRLGQLGAAAVNPEQVQWRIMGTCAAGQSIIAINQDGSVQCADLAGAGDITSVVAGVGLTGGAMSGDATLAVAFAGSGSSAAASRSDHHHLEQTWLGRNFPPFCTDCRGLTLQGQAQGAFFSSTNLRDSGIGVRGESYGFNGAGVEALGRGPLTAGLRAQADTGSALDASNNSDNLATVTIHALGLGDALNVHNADDLVFRVDRDGDVSADGAYNCGRATQCFNTGVGADLAERVDATEELQPGDVIEIDIAADGRYRLSRSMFSTTVAGVVSTAPAMTMNNNHVWSLGRRVHADTRPLLALAGVVPVKVTTQNGPIRVGDLLVSSSTPGRAMRAGVAPPAGTVIGKALEALHSGMGTISMLVMLR